MTKPIFQPSLFPHDKGDFNPSHLMALITQHPQFETWLKLGFTRAYGHLNQIECPMSKRLKSSNLHEFAFNELANALGSFPTIAPLIDVNQSKSGNEKNFFSFDDYIFILKKEDAPTNNTQMSQKIQQQEMNAHVLSVEYVVGPFQDSIISLSLVYYLGGQSVFSYNIPLSSVANCKSEQTEEREVLAIKPKLSKRALGQNAVG